MPFGPCAALATCSCRQRDKRRIQPVVHGVSRGWVDLLDASSRRPRRISAASSWHRAWSFSRTAGEAVLEGKGIKRCGDVLQQIALEGLRAERDQMVGSGTAGDAANPGACLPWRYSLRRQDCQRVRAISRGHPQGQSWQAQRVRQDGPGYCNPQSQAGTRSAIGGGGCRVRFRQRRPDRDRSALTAVHRETRQRQKRWASSAYAFPIGRPRVPSAKENRRDAGSARCEGRISVVKRRHGFNRCRYKSEVGMQRWVGLGVISDNLVNNELARRHRTGH